MAPNIATYRSFLGIAKQPVAGTPVAPTDYMTFTTDPKGVDTVKYLDDLGWRGSNVEKYGKIAGPRRGSMSIDGNLDLTTIGYPLQSLLADVVVTGAAAPFTTVFSTKNNGDVQGGAYTFSDFDGLDTRQYSDAKFEELTISATGDSLLVYKSKLQCWASTLAGAVPVPSYNAAPPPAGWTVVVNIAGTPVLNLNALDLNIKRAISVHDTIDGTQDPYRIWQGPLVVTGKLDFLKETDLEFNRYLQNTQVPLDIKVTQGTSSLQIHSTLTAFITGALDRSKPIGEMKTTFECLGNVTDAGASAGNSPLKATLVNSKASGTYA